MKVLVVEDEAAIRQVLERFLKTKEHEVATAASFAEAQKKLEDFRPDFALSDISLPDGSGLDLLSEMLKKFPSLPVLMITGAQDAKTAVEAMKRGAEDYLTKPFEMEELGLAVDRAAEKAGLRHEVSALRNYQKELGAQDYLFLNDPSMRRVYTEVEQLAALDKVTVLIYGETGTGKQHIARLVHRLSSRYAKPFVELHCAALPENLLESELFGYEAGAFTDAKGRKKGLFELAQGGTVFLDEVGELPASMQTKLLKVLEQKVLRRLGGLENIHLDFRLIAATNRRLEEEVDLGRFRADLFYRLNVTRVSLPPLQSRPDDIEELARFFFKEAAREFGKALSAPDPELLAALRNLPWKGNVRELKNTCERIVIHARSPRLNLDLLPEEYRTDGPRKESVASPSFLSPPLSEDSEKAKLEALLQKHHWNKVKVAAEMKISKPTLFKRLKKYGLQ